MGMCGLLDLNASNNLTPHEVCTPIFAAPCSKYLLLILEYCDSGDLKIRIQKVTLTHHRILTRVQSVCVMDSVSPINTPHYLPPVPYQAGKKNRQFHETQVMDWFVQLAFALEYLHSKKLAHRDIKVGILCNRALDCGSPK